MNQLPKNLKYYNISRNWKDLKPVYYSEPISKVCFREMNEYSKVRNWALNTDKSRFLPIEFDSCDWRCERKDRPPAFDDFICHAACHWIVNINLAVVKIAQPATPWRVVHSEGHSTLWDGNKTLFDTNFLGLRARCVFTSLAI